MCGKESTVKKKEILGSTSPPPWRTPAYCSEKVKKTNQMLGNTRLGVKSKIKNLIIPLYKSVVHCIWNAAHRFCLPTSKETVHKLEKGIKDDQELRSCYCTRECPTKNTEGRKCLFSTSHTRRIERQPNLRKCYCAQVKLWNLVP